MFIQSIPLRPLFLSICFFEKNVRIDEKNHKAVYKQCSKIKLACQHVNNQKRDRHQKKIDLVVCVPKTTPKRIFENIVKRIKIVFKHTESSNKAAYQKEICVNLNNYIMCYFRKIFEAFKKLFSKTIYKDEELIELVVQLKEINSNLVAVLNELKKINFRSSRPKIMVKLIEKGNNMLVYSVTAGTPGAGDVVERRMTIQVNGSVVDTKSYGGEVVDLGEIKVEENAEVVLNLVDVDNAGNVSLPAIFAFTALDTIAPPAPGSFGVSIVREEF